MTSMQATTRALASALTQQTINVGASTPAVRGGDMQTGTVTAVPGDGTVDVGVIPARCLDSYTDPAVGDQILLVSSSTGGWWAVGRTSIGVVGIGGEVNAYKTADTSRASTTTAAADPHLTVPVAANAVYRIDGYLIYLADTAADMRFGFSTPAGASGAFAIRGPDLSATNGTTAQVRIQSLPDFSNTIPTGGQSPTYSSARPVGTLATGANAGTFALIWCQNTSSATASTLLTHSTLTLTRIA